MNLMKAPLRSPEDAVTHTLINLRLRVSQTHDVLLSYMYY